MADSYPPIPSHPVPAPDRLIEIGTVTVGLTAIAADPVCRRIRVTEVRALTIDRLTRGTRTHRRGVVHPRHGVDAWGTSNVERHGDSPVVVTASPAESRAGISRRRHRHEECRQHCKDHNRTFHLTASLPVTDGCPPTAVNVHCLRRTRRGKYSRRPGSMGGRCAVTASCRCGYGVRRLRGRARDCTCLHVPLPLRF